MNTPGFRIYGDTNQTVLTACHSPKNGGDGFFVEDDCIGVTMNGCTATENGRNGFMDTGTRTLFTGCAAVKNIAQASSPSQTRLA